LVTISISEETAASMFRVQVRGWSGRIVCDTCQNMRSHNAIDSNLRGDSSVTFVQTATCWGTFTTVLYLLRWITNCPLCTVRRLIACHRCCWASSLSRIKNLTDRTVVIKSNLASTVNLLSLLVYTFHLFLNEDRFEVVKAGKTRATKISSLVTKRFQ